MKDSLKEFVDKNRQAFDDKIPGNILWTKISSRLPVMKEVSLWSSVMVWRIAAALFMGLSVFLLIREVPKSSEKRVAQQLQGDFKSIESFYRGEIAKKIALIDDFGGTFEGDHFTQDFEKLDAMYQVLGDEMKLRPTEKVRDALILNILIRVDLLNHQIKILEDLKKSDKKADAST